MKCGGQSFSAKAVGRIPPAPDAGAITLAGSPSCAEYQAVQVSGFRDKGTKIKNRNIHT
jgi:hypothetical protein